MLESRVHIVRRWPCVKGQSAPECRRPCHRPRTTACSAHQPRPTHSPVASVNILYLGAWVVGNRVGVHRRFQCVLCGAALRRRPRGGRRRSDKGRTRHGAGRRGECATLWRACHVVNVPDVVWRFTDAFWMRRPHKRRTRATAAASAARRGKQAGGEHEEAP